MASIKIRARTLDMLARRQTATPLTAISELFKNAHDADATRIAIDHDRASNLLVVRDDGCGMSGEDFVARWLTLATDSPLQAGNTGERLRTRLAEKGIGRLAVATLGPQVLVLTRAKGDEASALTAALVNWRLFEWPNIDLGEIDIPLKTFAAGQLPTARDITEMVDAIRANAEDLAHRVDPRQSRRLENELSQFDIDPQAIDSQFSEPSLGGSGHGTHYLVKPVSTATTDMIDERSKLRRAVLAFSNSMVPEPIERPRIAWRNHARDGSGDDPIGNDTFFTAEEFNRAKHHIQGTFDEYGRFQGDLSVHAETIHGHTIPWRNARGTPTRCGPFSIRLAVLDDTRATTTSNDEKRAELAAKTKRMGGLYVYRNGIRILPYGDQGTDMWLDMDTGRRQANDVPPHRRMFAAIELDMHENRQLTEKAAREGFQKNEAYRQFRSILQNFLRQVEMECLRTSTVRGDEQKIRAVLEAERTTANTARAHRERQASTMRTALEAELKTVFDRLEDNEPQRLIHALTIRVESKLRTACATTDKRQAASKILSIERQAWTDIRALEARYQIVRPPVGLSTDMQRDWSVYGAELERLHTNVFKPARKTLDDLIVESIELNALTIDRRDRLESALGSLVGETRETTRRLAEAIDEETIRIASKTRETTQRALRAVDAQQREATDTIRYAKPCARAARALEDKIRRAAWRQNTLLQSVTEQLEDVDATGECSTTTTLTAIEQRNIMLEEERRANEETVHLGTVVEILYQELSDTTACVHRGLRRLSAWAAANPGLQRTYMDLQARFGYLDAQMMLFAPTWKRLDAQAVEIHGQEIGDFVEPLFETRMARHGITLIMTRAFANARIIAPLPNLYPVFINLMDNAITWLAQQPSRRERTIRMDARDGLLLIHDTGPGVGTRNRKWIFERGFSTKPGGRGLGLHISRQALRRVGLELQLVDTSPSTGTTFGIAPQTPDECA